jgi:CheY-like chemotaxis protein
MSVLICDNEQDILNLMAEVVGELGHEVIPCLDGKCVISTATKSKPKLIILDFWLDGTDAREIIRDLRQQPEINDIPVLLVSAIANVEEVGSQLDVNGIIRKPFDIVKLQQIVTEILDQEALTQPYYQYTSATAA